MASISGPVGLRNRSQNVTSRSSDQLTIINLLLTIPRSQGGKAEEWTAAPRPGADGRCPKILADGIFDFQSFWKGQGLFQNIDGVVDPGGNTFKQMVKLAETFPGQARILQGPDQIVKEYPEFSEVVGKSGRTMLVELTHYDIASDELKPEHKDMIFTANLRAFDKDFLFVKAFGFHSNTGGANFNNIGLAERRAEKGMRFARFLGVIDARIKSWKFQEVRWQKGMEDGESPHMRRALLLFRARDTSDPLSVSSGPGKEKFF